MTMGFGDFKMVDTVYQNDRNKPKPKPTTTTTPKVTAPTVNAPTTTVRAADTTPYETERPSWIPTGSSRTGGGSSSSSSVDTDLIDKLAQAKMDAEISALDSKYGNQNANLDTQQAAIAPIYYNKRNQAAANTDVGALNFAQYMANRGIQGRAGAMPEIYRTSGLQGQIGALDQAEAAENATIERNRSTLKNDYEADKASVIAGAEATRLQNTIDQLNKNTQTAMQEAELTGTYNGQTTLQGQAQILANKKSQLENYALEIRNSYLPDTYKLEAEQLKQQVDSGRVDIDTALAQLARIRAGLKTL
jgi:hypothetical protein